MNGDPFAGATWATGIGSVPVSSGEPAREYPDGNPKTAIGATKVPLHLVPPSATHYTALAFKDGAAKYGPYNWREKGVSASVYYAAAKRHIDAWWDGEDLSPDALVHHLGHVMACCAIVLDAMSIGKLNDDRPPKGAASALQQAFGRPMTVSGEFDPNNPMDVAVAEQAFGYRNPPNVATGD